MHLFYREREREGEREKERERERAQARVVGKGEADSLPSREPNIGLDPRTLGSQLEPKADTQPLSHSGMLVPATIS